MEWHIQEALQFQNMDESALCQPSATGGWSITQNLSHLISYGAYYLPRLKTGLEQQPKHIPVTQPFESSWLGAYFTRLMDPKTSRKKFKAVKHHQPTEGVNPQRVIAEFIDQQEDLLYLLRLAGTVDVNTGRIPTSIMPWLRLNLGDTLQFVITHNERHIVQARRNTANNSIPD